MTETEEGRIPERLVVVTVEGGIADFHCDDPSVRVILWDWDNLRACQENDGENPVYGGPYEPHDGRGEPGLLEHLPDEIKQYLSSEKTGERV